MFTIIGGGPPFYGETNQETFKKILAVNYEYEEDSWCEITQDCKDMINGLLTKDMKERWSTQQCLDCAWMKDEPKKLRRCSLLPNMKKLMEFNARRKFKSAVKALNFADAINPDFKCELAGQLNDTSIAEIKDHRQPIED